ncbi:hypothetical protein SBA6_320024 [Candidatus Sulfopaludibacter sp. SbA6]|nr:hypothetical protein SBA6_320024 [Candidatus Sulfopaludibacter sp. SbA6]
MFCPNYNRPGGPDAGVKRWIETTDRQSGDVASSGWRKFKKESGCWPTAIGAFNWNSG